MNIMYKLNIKLIINCYFSYYIIEYIKGVHMKRIFIRLIKWYQMIPGNFHYSCKHIPTCSNYAIEAIEVYGAFKGSLMSIKRILKCNPFSKGGYDPVKR